MAENFGGSLNLIIWIVLTLGAIYYSYRCLFQTKAFNDQYGFGDQAIFITRFAGSQVGAGAIISVVLLFTWTTNTLNQLELFKLLQCLVELRT